MARPISTGISYFSLDVHLDDEFELIESKFGIVGFGLVIKLYQKIYSNSYYIEWTERELLKFKSRVNVDINLINDVINDCLKWGLLSKELYDQYNILTSRGIQKRYIEATQRRKEVTFIKEYLLVDLNDDTYPKTVNVNIYSINEDINLKKDDSNPQSKVKESKEKDDASTTTESARGPGCDFNFKAAVSAFENNLHLVSPIEAEQIADWLIDVDVGTFKLAIQEAVNNNARSMSYINTILSNWVKQGLKTEEAVCAFLRDRQIRKGKVVPLNGGAPRNKSDTYTANGNSHNKETEYPAGGIG